MAKSAATVDKAKESTKQTAQKAVANPWSERLMRFGYIIRGVVYFVPGLLALQLALGAGGGAVNQTGVIELIGQQPYGKILLIIVAMGLVGYSMWGLVRALFDPFREGDDAQGLLVRFGYVVSAFGYGTLLIAVLQYLQGAATSGNNPQDWSAKLLGQPYGRIVVAIIGLGWIIGGGLRQIYDAYRAEFKKDLQTGKMSPQERKWSIRIGRFGLAARGVVFAMIGIFLVQAAYWANPGNAKGLDGALLELARKPYGPELVAIVALGLMAFGVYSMLCARWMKMRVPKPKSSRST